jgi:hypothetical protein
MPAKRLSVTPAAARRTRTACSSCAAHGSWPREQWMLSAPVSRARSSRLSAVGPRRRTRCAPSASSDRPSASRLKCSHQRDAPPARQAPAAASSRMNTGRTGAPVAAAADRAAWSCSRRSRRNQTMIGGCIVTGGLFALLEPRTPCEPKRISDQSAQLNRRSKMVFGFFLTRFGGDWLYEPPNGLSHGAQPPPPPSIVVV